MNLTITTREIHEPDIFCFEFEKEFIAHAIRCIPMIVRYKLDTVGIKLTLAQWSRFSWLDRYQLSVLACRDKREMADYEIFLIELLKYHGWPTATRLPVTGCLPEIPAGTVNLLNQRLSDLGHQIDEAQWEELTELERFALSKLIRESHESKNLIPALMEFGILNPPG